MFASTSFENSNFICAFSSIKFAQKCCTSLHLDGFLQRNTEGWLGTEENSFAQQSHSKEYFSRLAIHKSLDLWSELNFKKISILRQPSHCVKTVVKGNDWIRNNFILKNRFQFQKKTELSFFGSAKSSWIIFLTHAGCPRTLPLLWLTRVGSRRSRRLPFGQILKPPEAFAKPMRCS